MNNDNKIACFIHSTNMHIHKTEILERILKYLKDRSIFDLLDLLVINNIGDDLDEAYFKNISEKIVVINYSSNTELFECATIKQVISFSKLHKDYKILYLHTKGVSRNKDEWCMNGVISWTNYMLYCLVDNANSCIKLLNTYDTVGCNFRGDSVHAKQHYSGNFWWATSEYLQKLKYTDFN